MTIREWCEGYCFQRGMLPDQAKAVIDRMAVDPASKFLGDVWRQEISGYPPHFTAFLAAMIRPHAVAWIDENLPRAWYRPMFEDSPAPPSADEPAATGQGASQSS